MVLKHSITKIEEINRQSQKGNENDQCKKVVVGETFIVTKHKNRHHFLVVNSKIYR